MKKSIELFVDEINIKDKKYLLERVLNLDDLVDEISDELFAEDERLPYWAELWPSALGMSEFIDGNPAIFSDKRILELGCGLGLTTMVLANTRPKHFLATDYETAALNQTRKNFQLNNIDTPDLKLLDWRAPHLTEKYDVILASDVAYEQRFFEPLIQLFKKYLMPDGIIILAEPNRAIARSFFGKLLLNGFVYTRTDKFVKQLEKDIKISIYKIGFKYGD